MTTCANCTNNAAFVYEISPSHQIPYCSTHLPKFLNDQKNAGLLKLASELVQDRTDAFDVLAPKTTKKASSKKTTEETPAEEPVVEETPATPAE
jgi:hypothetical protein